MRIRGKEGMRGKKHGGERVYNSNDFEGILVVLTPIYFKRYK
jgi:hypothetical protein